MRNPWAFRIDYDAAIAADEATIAGIVEAMANGWYVMPFTFDGKDYELSRVSDMAMCVPGFAAKLGMTRSDVADVVACRYQNYGDPVPASILACHGDDILDAVSTGVLPADMPGFKGEMWNACYVNGRKWQDILHDKLTFKNEEAAKAALKKAKASLARHKRNKAKFGK